MIMNNKEKFDEHRLLKDQCITKGFYNIKPSVYEMEKLKYSDDPLLRKTCALIEYADELYIAQILRKSE